MFPDPDGHAMKPIDPLAAALRALPMAEPPRDLYAQIAQTLRMRRSRRRWLIPTALAAGILLGVFVLRTLLPDPAEPESSRTADLAMQTPASASELDSLHAYSRSLESWLAALSDDAPREGRNLMAAAELEDLIGLVDVQLSATRNESESLPLWRQRVALLEDLAAVRSEPFTLAAEAGRADAATPTL